MTSLTPHNHEGTPQPEDVQTKPLLDHFVELRTRLLWTFAIMLLGTCVCYVFVQDIYGFMVRPLAEASGDANGRRLIYTGLTEAFFTYLKVAFFAGIFVTFPIFAIQIWTFIAPGLYKNERWAF